jgi:hypothetical protein
MADTINWSISPANEGASIQGTNENATVTFDTNYKTATTYTVTCTSGTHKGTFIVKRKGNGCSGGGGGGSATITYKIQNDTNYSICFNGEIGLYVKPESGSHISFDVNIPGHKQNSNKFNLSPKNTAGSATTEYTIELHPNSSDPSDSLTNLVRRNAKWESNAKVYLYANYYYDVRSTPCSYDGVTNVCGGGHTTGHITATLDCAGEALDLNDTVTHVIHITDFVPSVSTPQACANQAKPGCGNFTCS